MEPIIALVGTSTFLISYVYAIVRAEERARAWQAAARKARLTEVKVSRPGGVARSLTGRIGSLRVHLDVDIRHRAQRGTRIVISGLEHLPDDLSFRRQAFGAKGRAAHGELILGDADFDQVVQLRGSRELACAIFDARTRLMVMRLVQGQYQPGVVLPTRAALSDGELRLEIWRRRWGREPAAALPHALRVAARLRRPADLVAHLVENARHDPLAAVRLSNLDLLLQGHGQDPRAQRALRDALSDGNVEIRLRAALAVGPRGRDALRAIATASHSEDGQAGRAIAGLAEQVSGDQARAMLEEALKHRRPATARACLQRLGEVGGSGSVTVLGRVLAREESELAMAAAGALGATGAAGEAALLEALQAPDTTLFAALRGERTEVLAAVAEALGQSGTAAAVMPLHQASERLPDRDFQRAARQAIAHIQSRLVGASPGQLSLASSAAGQVSLTEDDAAGRLTLPPKTPD